MSKETTNKTEHQTGCDLSPLADRAPVDAMCSITSAQLAYHVESLAILFEVEELENTGIRDRLFALNLWLSNVLADRLNASGCARN